MGDRRERVAGSGQVFSHHRRKYTHLGIDPFLVNYDDCNSDNDNGNGIIATPATATTQLAS